MSCSPQLPPDDTWAMFRAPELVQERMMRATQALQNADVYYAVIGAIAVGFWVGTRDEGAIRNTPNVDVLIYPSMVALAQAALESVGFVREGEGARPAVFLDGPTGKTRQAVRLWLVDDQISVTSEPLPSLLSSLPTFPRRMIALPTLVRMKLSAWRTIDKVHLRDLLGVGLLDDTWPARFPDVLAERLREVLSNPDG